VCLLALGLFQKQQDGYIEISVIIEIQLLARPQFYGKYKGVVTDVLDPLEICRIRARVPSVYWRFRVLMGASMSAICK
jgi:hypothetical protein